MAIFILPILIWSALWFGSGAKTQYCSESKERQEECKRDLDERRQWESNHVIQAPLR